MPPARALHSRAQPFGSAEIWHLLRQDRDQTGAARISGIQAAACRESAQPGLAATAFSVAISNRCFLFLARGGAHD